MHWTCVNPFTQGEWENNSLLQRGSGLNADILHGSINEFFAQIFLALLMPVEEVVRPLR